MARDRNDARVSFTTLCREYGLTLEQSKSLWLIVTPPYPEPNVSGSGS